MKKISTLIALATLVTVGSVYASWTYASSGKLSNSFYLDGSTNVGITDKVGAEKGSLSIDRNNFSIVIDDTDNDHNADFSVNGYLLITYTPSLAITNEEKQNGLDLVFTLESTIPAYDGIMIFSVCLDAHEITNVVANSVDPVTGYAESFTYTISAVEIDKALSFYTNTFSEDEATDDGVLTLDEESEYDAFKVQLHAGALQIIISEK